jgi:DNA polymerase elongation subunit (family B)
MLKLFYTDTDSIYTNLNPDKMNELYPNIISSTGLGKLKLESSSNKAIFLAPKLYYLRTIDSKVIIILKGLEKAVKLSEQDFIELLSKIITIIKLQDKGYKSIEDATISIKNQIYIV